eukprot:4233783-Prymnesium_polylepis.2
MQISLLDHDSSWLRVSRACTIVPWCCAPNSPTACAVESASSTLSSPAVYAAATSPIEWPSTSPGSWPASRQRSALSIFTIVVTSVEWGAACLPSCWDSSASSSQPNRWPTAARKTSHEGLAFRAARSVWAQCAPSPVKSGRRLVAELIVRSGVQVCAPALCAALNRIGLLLVLFNACAEALCTIGWRIGHHCSGFVCRRGTGRDFGGAPRESAGGAERPSRVGVSAREASVAAAGSASPSWKMQTRHVSPAGAD